MYYTHIQTLYTSSIILVQGKNADSKTNLKKKLFQQAILEDRQCRNGENLQCSDFFLERACL